MPVSYTHLPEWTAKKICDDGVVLSEKDKKELKPMEKIKLVMTRNKDDEKDLLICLAQKRIGKNLTVSSKIRSQTLRLPLL